jgi:hypothetical protein
VSELAQQMAAPLNAYDDEPLRKPLWSWTTARPDVPAVPMLSSYVVVVVVVVVVTQLRDADVVCVCLCNRQAPWQSVPVQRVNAVAQTISTPSTTAHAQPRTTTTKPTSTKSASTKPTNKQKSSARPHPPVAYLSLSCHIPSFDSLSHRAVFDV